MPTYDYVCTNCGHRLEVLHGVNAPGPSACPDCGGRLRRSFSPPTIHFKGSGWAKVDRRSASSSRSSKADPDAAPAAASSDDGSKTGDTASGDGEHGSPDSSSEAPPAKTSERSKSSRAERRALEPKAKASHASE